MRKKLASWWGWIKVFAQALYILWHQRRFRKMVQSIQLDVNHPCPACGNRQGKLSWDSEIAWPDHTKGAIRHICTVCNAFWFEKPIIKAAEWVLKVDESQRGVTAPWMNGPQEAPRQRSFSA